MKRLIQYVLTVVFILTVSLFIAACGDSGGSSGITQAQTSSFVSFLAGAGTSALGTTSSAQGRPVGSLDKIRARILNAVPGGNLRVKPESLVVHCNAQGTSCTFSDAFNVPYSCQSGANHQCSRGHDWHRNFDHGLPVDSNS